MNVFKNATALTSATVAIYRGVGYMEAHEEVRRGPVWNQLVPISEAAERVLLRQDEPVSRRLRSSDPEAEESA